MSDSRYNCGIVNHSTLGRAHEYFSREKNECSSNNSDCQIPNMKPLKCKATQNVVIVLNVINPYYL